MTCPRLIRYVDQFMDRELSDAHRVELERHIDDCASCQLVLAREQHMHRALRTLPAAEPNPRFFEHALRSASKAPRTRRTASWKVALTATIAASAATWFVVAHLPSTTANEDLKPVAMVSMGLHEVRTIELVFDSANSLEGAQLALHLPPGIELAHKRSRQDFRFKTRLQAGRNILPLELVARDGVGGDLVARLTHDGVHETFRVKFTVSTRSTHT